MKTWVYTICWNEAEMLPYFLRHYESIADKIVIYDHHSTDETVDVARAHPLVELRKTNNHEHDERNLQSVKGQAWKESRQQADWVICCDADELLYHPNATEYLQECGEKGVTFPQVQGYELVSEHFPTGPGNIYEIVRTGFRRHLYSKRIVFSPSDIENINYTPGCHKASPTGRVVQDRTCEFKLLHCGSIGRQRLLERRATIARKISDYNISNGYSTHYCASMREVQARFENFLAGSRELWFLNGQQRAPWELPVSCRKVLDRIFRIRSLERQ